MLADRQTDRHTHTHTHTHRERERERETYSPQYFATAPMGEVTSPSIHCIFLITSIIELEPLVSVN